MADLGIEPEEIRLQDIWSLFSFLCVFKFCGYILGVYVYWVQEVLRYRNGMCNNPNMENWVSIPASIYPLCYKQYNYSLIDAGY